LERITYLKKILETPQMVLDIIKEEMTEIKEKYANPRRTEITYTADDNIDMDELIQEEEMVVTLTHFGYVKRIRSDAYRTQRRGGKGITGLSAREEDFAEHVIVTSTHSTLMFFTNRGKVYKCRCYNLPETSRTAKGMAIVNLLNLDAGEKVSAVFPATGLNVEKKLVIVTRDGYIKKTKVSEFANIRQNGLIAIGLREGDELVSVLETSGHDNLILGTAKGMSIMFSEEDVRDMGRTAMGVKAVELREGDRVVGIAIAREGTDVLVISENGYGKRTPLTEYKVQKRGGIGVRTLNITDKTGDMCALGVVDGTEDIMLINDAGIIIRTRVSEISVYGRDTQGVRLMNVDEDSRVVSAALVPPDEDENGNGEGEEEGAPDAPAGE
jgi:DNA gyrase subunit A